MWTRKELKERAKAALKRNYWKAVLVTVILLVIGGGASSGSVSYGYDSGSENAADIQEEIVTFVQSEDGSVQESIQSVGTKLNELSETDKIAIACAFIITFCIIFVIVMVVVFAINCFLYNPLKIGAHRFMLKSVDGEGKVGELAYTFDHSYMNGVKTMFFRDLYVFLWTLLFIIPGIYKKYQYYMVENILAENPDMPYKEVLKRSTEMMDGQKWRTFVLDISFILWDMLGMITCGLVEVFFTMPYKYLTHAALYRELCGGTQDVSETIEMQEI